VTSVLVTHDQEEALEVADRVVVMNQAKIEQVGTPEDVFHKPATEFVMSFLGQVNVFHGRVGAGQATLGELAIDYPQYPQPEERPATLYMRPHELDIKRERNGVPSLAARVARVNPAGPVAKISLRTADEHELFVDLSLDRYEQLQLKVGDSVFVYPRAARVFVPEYVI
jgi:sulfate transport system ATP-binding protein